MLRTSRGSHILASSREALGIAGESAWHVPSLATPNPAEPLTLAQLEKYAAIQLFIERATQALAMFKVTNANAPAIAQICRRLDGIPLAIELAAARVKTLSAEQIAARLDEATFNAAWEAGRTLTLDQAIALALKQTDG